MTVKLVCPFVPRRALVAALVSANRLDAACETLDWMAEDGVVGNAVVYQTLINAFLERGQHAQVAGGWGARAAPQHVVWCACLHVDRTAGLAPLCRRQAGPSVPSHAVQMGTCLNDERQTCFNALTSPPPTPPHPPHPTPHTERVAQQAHGGGDHSPGEAAHWQGRRQPALLPAMPAAARAACAADGGADGTRRPARRPGPPPRGPAPLTPSPAPIPPPPPPCSPPWRSSRPLTTWCCCSAAAG